VAPASCRALISVLRIKWKGVDKLLSTERFSDVLAPKKRDIRERIAARIRSEISKDVLNAGVNIVSLIGPNVGAFFREFNCLLGSPNSKVFVAENTPESLAAIKRASRSIPLVDDMCMDIPAHPCDFYERVWYVAFRFKSQCLILDADFCQTWGTAKEDFFRELGELLPQVSGEVFITLTRSLREQNRLSAEDVINDIEKLGLSCLFFEGYGDGQPMETFLFRRPAS
jgi:hypothetical protein